MTLTGLTSEQALRLHMTPAGYELALATFGRETVDAVVAQYADVRLAAAQLLESLPADTAVDSLSSFRLDVLEFKFRDTSKVSLDWAARAARLRESVNAEAAAASRSANPAPELESWGLG